MYATGMKLPCNKSIVELLREQAYFMYFRDDKLCYKTESGFVFEVPVSDCAGGTFKHEDKAMFFMRWVRPAYGAAVRDLNAKPKTAEVKNPMAESSDPIEYVGSGPDGFRGDHTAHD